MILAALYTKLLAVGMNLAVHPQTRNREEALPSFRQPLLQRQQYHQGRQPRQRRFNLCRLLIIASLFIGAATQLESRGTKNFLSMKSTVSAALSLPTWLVGER